MQTTNLKCSVCHEIKSKECFLEMSSLPVQSPLLKKGGEWGLGCEGGRGGESGIFRNLAVMYTVLDFSW